MDLADYRAVTAGSQMPTVAALAGEALATCHAELLAARQTVLSTRDPSGIHATRVALRRIRAAATLFGRALGDEAVLALRTDAKQLADACGPTRDLDVFLGGALAEAETLLASRDDIAAEFRSFRAIALRLRRARHDAVRRVLAGDVFTVFDARLAGLLARPSPVPASPPLQSDAPSDVDQAPPDAAAFARDVLRRRDRKLRKRVVRLDRLDGAGRHALRLRVKKQRYAATFLAGLFDRKAAAAYIRGAAGLQDALGLANDRVVAAHVVADVRAAARPKGRVDWIAGVLAGWLAACGQLGGGDDAALAAAARRFSRAPRFWRRKARGGDGEDG
jgi:CHAD domain-containing protein